jgi:hypothetical protein
MSSKHLTAIIPCFNIQRDSSNLLDLGLKLNRIPIDLILIVSDPKCSTDDLADFKLVFNQIKICPGASAGRSRNFGLELVTTNFVWFIDSDDHIVEEFLPLLTIQIQEANKDIVMAQHYNSNFGSLSISRASISQKNESLLEALQGDIGVWRFIFRTQTVRNAKVFFPDLNFGEDLVFLLQLNSAGATLGFFEHPIYIHNNRQDSVTYNQLAIRQSVEVLQIIEGFMSKTQNSQSGQINTLHARVLASAFLRANIQNRLRIFKYLLKRFPDSVKWLKTIVLIANIKKKTGTKELS